MKAAYKLLTYWAMILLLPVSLASPSDAQQQGRDERRGGGSNPFMERERAALKEPFVGVHDSGGRVDGLFPVRATGVSTKPIQDAAASFLAALTPDQRDRTQYPIDDSEWRRWSNVDVGIYKRQGVSFREMDPKQQAAARALLSVSLSVEGLALTDAVRRTDQTLAEINNDPQTFDEQAYFLTVMGTPSPSEPWGWQLDGHHLVVNYFVLGDQVVMTPSFFGGEPIHTTTGKYAGNVLLQKEQDLGLALAQSLTAEQAEAAILSSRKTRRDLKAGANSDNLVLDYSGIQVSTFSDEQRRMLIDLVAQFVNNLPADHAKIRMDEVLEHLDATWFAWVGPRTDDAVFYYRIHSPVLLIEFDHQSPVGTRKINSSREATRDHIHIIIRTPNGNDYGNDLLRQHLEQHSH